MILATSVVAGDSPPDVNELVRQSVANYQRDHREGANWRYLQTDTTTSGGVKVQEVSEVTPLLGTPYERLLKRNGGPLSPADQKKEDEKYEKTLQKRQSESGAEKAARLAKYEGEWSFLADLPAAYDFRLLGEEELNGRPAWIVGLTPRAGFSPTTQRGALLKHIEGRLWIDKQDVQWAKAEAHVIDTISIGWIVARVGPGAEIKLALRRVGEGVWLPAQVDIEGNARVLMVHRKDLNEQLVFSEYRPVGGATSAGAGKPANMTVTGH